MTINEYTQLKEAICIQALRGCQFDLIKNTFYDHINSPRKFETIKSMHDLLRILEKRALLSVQDVSILQEICELLPNNDNLQEKITRYQPIAPRIENHGKLVWILTLLILFASLLFGFGNYYTEEEDGKKIKKDLIYEKLVNEIGKSWVDFARNLKIREGMIDSINAEKIMLPEKVLKVLKIHEHNMPEDKRRFYEVCNALEKSRRKDLSKMIQEIMILNL